MSLRSGAGHPDTDGAEGVYRLRCEPLSYFFDFADIGRDKLSNAVMLPEFAFGDGGPFDENGYVAVYPADQDEEGPPAARPDAAPTVFPVRPLPRSDLKPAFDDDLTEELREGERHLVGSIRTNMLQQVYGTEYRPELVIEPLSVETFERVVYPEYADETPTGYNCYLSAEDIEEAPFEAGDVVEVRSEQSGGRLPLTVHELNPSWKLDRRIDEPVVGVDGYSRRILGIEKKQIGSVSLSVYRSVQAETVRPSWRAWLLGRLVGAESTRLRVESGISRDEYNGIGRVSADTMASLGVDPGDVIVLAWNGRSTRVRCLETPGRASETPAARHDDESVFPGHVTTSEEPSSGGRAAADPAVESLTIKLPHTVRDAIGVNIGDGVVVRRDVSYMLRKRIALSLFGIIGIFVGGLQIGLLFSPLATVELLLLAVTLVLTAGFAVWLVFYPERQRTTRSSTLRERLFGP